MTFFFVRSCRLLIESDSQPGAFDDAVSGVEAIAHTASTVSFAAADPVVSSRARWLWLTFADRSPYVSDRAHHPSGGRYAEHSRERPQKQVRPTLP